MNRSPKKGFTLIELLVVIAIIAILASILFPVFAQAKEAAKKTQCLSGTKQISLGILMYTGDYDDIVPPVHNCDVPPAPRISWFCGGSYERRDWNMVVRPYIKTPINGGNSIYKCPDLEADVYGNWTPNPTSQHEPWSSQFTSYGMNLDYLQPDPDCGSGNLLPNASIVWGLPVASTQVEAPADTVLLTETKPLVIISGPNRGAFYPSNLVDSPAGGGYPGSNSRACGLDSWGVDDSFEPEGIGGDTGVPNTSTAQFMPRHSGGGCVAFCDGHSKYMKPGNLAQGTNWYKGISAADVRITDLAKYLWSLKKTGSDL